MVDVMMDVMSHWRLNDYTACTMMQSKKVGLSMTLTLVTMVVLKAVCSQKESTFEEHPLWFNRLKVTEITTSTVRK